MACVLLLFMLTTLTTGDNILDKCSGLLARLRAESDNILKMYVEILLCNLKLKYGKIVIK